MKVLTVFLAFLFFIAHHSKSFADDRSGARSEYPVEYKSEFSLIQNKQCDKAFHELINKAKLGDLYALKFTFALLFWDALRLNGSDSEKINFLRTVMIYSLLSIDKQDLKWIPTTRDLSGAMRAIIHPISKDIAECFAKEQPDKCVRHAIDAKIVKELDESLESISTLNGGNLTVTCGRARNMGESVHFN
ncbi:MAG: hypothetical protein AB7U86_14890 [Methylocystis sp.]|uniref:hypothetical protein n=1 Tax=Methylocystis sp. TaxID=1911079 RepID=UPI003D0E69BD